MTLSSQQESNDKKAQVQDYFARNAEGYVASFSHRAGNDLERLIELGEWDSQQHALDIATGGGHTALAVALRLGLAAALETVKGPQGDEIDLATAQEVIGEVGHLIDRLSKIESYHSSAKRSIDSAGSYLDDLKAQIQALLRRLDQILGL